MALLDPLAVIRGRGGREGEGKSWNSREGRKRREGKDVKG